MDENKVKLEEAKEKVIKKIPETSVSKRQLELLRKRYDVNEEKRIVKVTLRYEKASDVLLTNVGRKENPQFNPDVIDTINKLIENIPLNYRAEIHFDISDYEGYDPKNIMLSFNDALELRQYSARRGRKNRWLISTILVLIGIVCLFLLATGKVNGWFGQGINSEIITEIIDITGWVFVWEAVSLMFLEPTEQATFTLKMREKIAFISFNTESGEELREDEENIFENWREEGKIKNIGRVLLLGSSAAFVALAFFSIFNMLSSISELKEMTPGNIVAVVIFALITIAFHLIAGLGGFMKYSGKNNWLSRSVGPIAIIICVLMIMSTALSFVADNLSTIVSSISSLIINIFYVCGYFIDRYSK